MLQNLTNKQIGWGIGIIVVGYLLFTSNSDSAAGPSDPTGNSGTPQLDPGSGFNANRVANELYEAMRHINFLPNNDEILTILGNVSQAQFGQVFKAFGRKYYNKTTGNQTEYFGIKIGAHDLRTWMQSELSSKDYNFWKLKYPLYL